MLKLAESFRGSGIVVSLWSCAVFCSHFLHAAKSGSCSVSC